MSNKEIRDTLSERGSDYGDFREVGRVVQNIKRAMHDSPNWTALPSYIKESLEMMASKFGRVLNGNPLLDDNFHDVVGYAKLAQDRIAQDRENEEYHFDASDPLYPKYDHETRTSVTQPEVYEPRNSTVMDLEVAENIIRMAALTGRSVDDTVLAVKAAITKINPLGGSN